jgi:Protein of unknown function (DUF2589)
VIDAQAKAAVSTANFVNTMGFTQADADGVREAVMIEFTYATTNATTGEVQTSVMGVPLLTILPVPYLRVKTCSIEFNAKISGFTKSETMASSSLSTTMSSRADVWFASTSMSTTFSSTVERKDTTSESREFSMRVRVEAVQDEMPGGLSKVLSILEEAILKGIRTPKK